MTTVIEPTPVSPLGSTFTPFRGARPIYVRNTGNNDYDGSTVELAVATFDRAMQLFDYTEKGYKLQYLELTGYTETLPLVGVNGLSYSLPSSPRAAANAIDFDNDFNDGKQDFLGYPIGFYADPVSTGVAITITSYTVDNDTGLFVVNVSETLTVDAHVGQFISVGPAEQGVIHSNTANTLTVSSNFLGTTGATFIYEQSCVLTLTTLFGLTMVHNGPVSMSGIKIVGGNLKSHVNVYSYFLLCSFEGFYIEGPGALCRTEACYFNAERIQCEGVAIEMVSNVLQGVEIRSHGSGGNGKNTLSYCILDGCTAYGSGNHENSFDVEVENTLIDNATGDGIHKQSPQQCRVSNTKIRNSVGHAIRADVGGGHIRVDNVTGTGNGGYGLFLQNGCQAAEIGTCSVTGTSGEIKVGGSVASTWGSAERTDAGETNPQFCRIF